MDAALMDVMELLTASLYKRGMISEEVSFLLMRERHITSKGGILAMYFLVLLQARFSSNFSSDRTVELEEQLRRDFRSVDDGEYRRWAGLYSLFLSRLGSSSSVYGVKPEAVSALGQRVDALASMTAALLRNPVLRLQPEDMDARDLVSALELISAGVRGSRAFSLSV